MLYEFHNNTLIVYHLIHHLMKIYNTNNKFTQYWNLNIIWNNLFKLHQVWSLKICTRMKTWVYIFFQYLLEAGYCSNNGRVVVTGPRVAAAVALASRVAYEQGTYCNTEGTVGYAVSFDTKYGSDTKIKVVYIRKSRLPKKISLIKLHFQYVTEGILLREMFSDPLLTQYSCIILDEVHERSQLTDIIMGLVKKIMRVI